MFGGLLIQLVEIKSDRTVNF